MTVASLGPVVADFTLNATGVEGPSMGDSGRACIEYSQPRDCCTALARCRPSTVVHIVELNDRSSAGADKTIPLKRDYLEDQNMVSLRPYFTAENQSPRCRYPV